MTILLVEHVLAWFAQLFREYDIKCNGKVDVNGLLRAPRESVLGTIQVFVDCLLTGFIAKKLFSISWDEIYSQPYAYYWIMIDVIIM
jgi:hypothetical protein